MLPPKLHHYPLDAFEAVVWFLDDRIRDESANDPATRRMREGKLLNFLEVDPGFVGMLIAVVHEEIANPSRSYALSLQLYALKGFDALDRLIEEKEAGRVTAAEAEETLLRPEIHPTELNQGALKTLGKIDESDGSLLELDRIRKEMPDIRKRHDKINREWSESLAKARRIWAEKTGAIPPRIESMDYGPIFEAKGIRLSPQGGEGARSRSSAQKKSR